MSLEDEFLKLKSTVQQLKDRQDLPNWIQRECRARDRQDVAMIEVVGGRTTWTSMAPSCPRRPNTRHVPTKATPRISI